MSDAGEWISVKEAAERIGATPWHVVRLAESNAIESVLLIRADSLDALKERQS